MNTKREQPSKTYTGTVSSKRQITIPAEAFRALHLQPGDKVTIQVSGRELRVTPEVSDFEAITRQHITRSSTPSNAHQDVREMRGWVEYENGREE